MKKQGLLLILSGPSGSGKGTIVEQLKAKDDLPFPFPLPLVPQESMNRTVCIISSAQGKNLKE